MTYSITRRIETENGLFRAVVCAVPQDRGAFAVVRTHDCDSQNAATSLLDALARALGLELTALGDVVLDAGDVR